MPGETEHGRGGGHGFLILLVGIVLGVVAAIVGPRWIGPYFPDVFRKGGRIEGQVLDKVPELDRLLLRVSTEDGLILVTFSRKLKELDLLIEKGDLVTLGTEGFQTFIDDPVVERVKRTEGRVTAPEEESETEPEHEEPGTEQPSEPELNDAPTDQEEIPEEEIPVPEQDEPPTVS